jgi:hypothetical protein
MDPFGRLPWFALQNILSSLPDLPLAPQLAQRDPRSRSIPAPEQWPIRADRGCNHRKYGP